MKTWSIKTIRIKFQEIFSLDLRSLAVFRIGLGLLILYDLFARAKHLSAHYTDEGILSRIASQFFWGDRLVFSLHFLSGEAWFQIILFVVAAVFALMFLVGYKTKLATVISWIFLVSLQVRNPMIAQGGDLLMRIALFWAMFLPLGAQYSIDSAKQPTPQKSPTLFSMGVVMYALQIIFMYIFASLFKIYSPAWVSDGSAIYYSLNFTPSATNLGLYLLNFPGLLSFLTLSTVWFEMLWIFLLFSPIWREQLRLIGVIGLVFFHAGLSITINPELFPFIGITTSLAFLPPLFWDKIFAWLEKPRFTNLKIYYDGECGFCKKAVLYIKTFFLLPQVELVSASEHVEVLNEMTENNSWVVTDNSGERYYKFDGLIAIVKASPLLFFSAPILSLYPIRNIGLYVYEYVALHRKRKCVVVDEREGWKKIDKKLIRHISIVLKTSQNLILLFLIVLIFLWNLGTLKPNSIQLPKNLRNLVFVTGINQRWAMFSGFPSPFRVDRWHDISGTLSDGTKVNIPQHGGYRWMKYMVRLSWGNSVGHRQYYGEYLCNSWNSSHEPDEQLSNLSIRRTTEFIPPPNSPTTAQVRTYFWEYGCSPVL